MFSGTVIWVKTIHFWCVFMLVISHLLFKSFMEWAVRSVWRCWGWVTPMTPPKTVVYRFLSWNWKINFYLLVSSLASWKELSEEDDELCFESSSSLWRLLGLFLSELTLSAFSSFIFSPLFLRFKTKSLWIQKFLIVIVHTFRQTNFHIDNANLKQ